MFVAQPLPSAATGLDGLSYVLAAGFGTDEAALDTQSTTVKHCQFRMNIAGIAAGDALDIHAL
jgi:hypothetical protein